MEPRRGGGNSRMLWIGIGCVAAAILIFYLVFSAVRANRRANEAQLRIEQMQLDQAQQVLGITLNSRKYLMDDSVKRELNDKYEAARVQVEKLQQELTSQKRKSAAEIAKLRDEISTLRNLLRRQHTALSRNT